MGLFGSNKNKRREEYLAIENGNYHPFDYEYLKEKISENNFIDDDDAYYGIRAFLITISNVDVVNAVFADAERKEKWRFGFEPGKLQKLTNAWTLEEMMNEDNVFRAVINNKTFIKKGELLMMTGHKIYEYYVQGLYGLESARDEESVIFNSSLYSEKENDAEKIIRYDLLLKEKYPQYRKEVLYYVDKGNGALGVNKVEIIEEKMKELGIDF